MAHVNPCARARPAPVNHRRRSPTTEIRVGRVQPTRPTYLQPYSGGTSAKAYSTLTPLLALTCFITK